MTTRTIRTGISPEYVKDWTIGMAIREVLQNYLDSKAEFDCDGSIIWGDGLAKVKDNGPGIEMKHLAIGISEKGMNSIGKFGEGLKLAMLVMAREGRKIELWSAGRIIRPRIRLDKDYQTEVLIFQIKNMLPRHAAKFTGTSVKFQCSKEELDQGRSYFIELQSKDKRIHWMTKDEISLPGGRLYINGAAVGTIEDANFSYHVHGIDGRTLGNRDRTTIDLDKVAPIVKRILSNCRCMNVMETILEDVRDRRQSFEKNIGINTYGMYPSDKKLWKRSINKVFGKETLLSDGNNDQNRGALYRGYEVISPSYQWEKILSECGMKRPLDVIRNKKKAVRIIKRKDLDSTKSANLKTAKRLVESHYAKTGSIVIAEDLKEKAGMSGSNNALGLWVPTEKKIYLKHTVLDDLSSAVHTLLHEVVHKTTGTDDCTPEFEAALTNVAVGMMMKEVKIS